MLNQATKSMDKIWNSKGNLVSSSKEILEVGHMFYKDLYPKGDIKMTGCHTGGWGLNMDMIKDYNAPIL